MFENGNEPNNNENEVCTMQCQPNTLVQGEVGNNGSSNAIQLPNQQYGENVGRTQTQSHCDNHYAWNRVLCHDQFAVNSIANTTNVVYGLDMETPQSPQWRTPNPLYYDYDVKLKPVNPLMSTLSEQNEQDNGGKTTACRKVP